MSWVGELNVASYVSAGLLAEQVPPRTYIVHLTYVLVTLAGVYYVVPASSDFLSEPVVLLGHALWACSTTRHLVAGFCGRHLVLLALREERRRQTIQDQERTSTFLAKVHEGGMWPRLPHTKGAMWPLISLASSLAVLVYWRCHETGRSSITSMGDTAAASEVGC